MKNKVIEEVVDEFIDSINESQEFKQMFKAHIENRFEMNASITDLENLLTKLSIQEDE
jgi:hypothetical protein